MGRDRDRDRDRGRDRGSAGAGGRLGNRVEVVAPVSGVEALDVAARRADERGPEAVARADLEERAERGEVADCRGARNAPPQVPPDLRRGGALSERAKEALVVLHSARRGAAGSAGGALQLRARAEVRRERVCAGAPAASPARRSSAGGARGTCTRAAARARARKAPPSVLHTRAAVRSHSPASKPRRVSDSENFSQSEAYHGGCASLFGWSIALGPRSLRREGAGGRAWGRVCGPQARGERDTSSPSDGRISGESSGSACP
jgi:hypothetical protein